LRLFQANHAFPGFDQKQKYKRLFYHFSDAVFPFPAEDEREVDSPVFLLLGWLCAHYYTE
jgi:hypothetical protein